MVRSLRKRIGAALLCAGFISLGFGVFTPAVQAASGDFAVDFAAADPDRYDPTTDTDTNDPSWANKVESLEGGDFDCNDTVRFLMHVEVTGAVTNAQLDLTQLFAQETTGHKNGTPALGYGEPVSVALLIGDGAHLDGGTAGAVAVGTVDSSGANVVVPIALTGLDEDDVFIVQTKVEIVCDPLVVAKDNTGNLHASLELASAGKQTVPMKSAANVIVDDPGALLTIVKDASPDVAQDFSFTSTGGLDPATFSLDDDTDNTLDNSRTFVGVDDGTYTVTEGLASGGYALTGLACVESGTTTPFAGATTDLTTRTASITVASSDDVTCTFTNTFQSSGCPGCPSFGSLRISKEVVSASGGEAFAFTAVCGSTTSNFNLGDGQSTTIFDIPLGTECAVTEEPGVDTETVTWDEGVQDSDGGADGVIVISGDDWANFTNTRTEVQAAAVETTTTTTTTTIAPAATPTPTVQGVVLARTGVETRDLMIMAGIALALGGLLLAGSEAGGRRTARARA